MRKLALAVVVSLIAAGVGVSGQAGQQAQRSMDGKVVLSGCIQNAPATQDQPGATAKFVLADAKPAGDAPVGTAGTPAKMADSYRLEGEEKTISSHLNQRVEITGMLQKSSTSAGAAGSTGRPTLEVESVKLLATKCS